MNQANAHVDFRLDDHLFFHFSQILARRTRALNAGLKPHGLDYSLTLHDGDGQRILGFDNAHAIKEGSGPGAKTRIEYDHAHKGERVRFYDHTDAGALVTDFWTEVDKILKGRIKTP